MKYVMSDKSPSQTFRIVGSGAMYDFMLRSFRGSVYATIIANDQKIVSGKKIVSDVDLLPSWYSKTVGGNFKFIDIDNDIVTTDRFDGISCALYFEEG